MTLWFRRFELYPQNFFKLEIPIPLVAFLLIMSDKGKGRKSGKIQFLLSPPLTLRVYGSYLEAKLVNGIKHSTMVGDVFQRIFVNIKPSQEKILFLQIGLSRWKVGFNLYSREYQMKFEGENETSQRTQRTC